MLKDKVDLFVEVLSFIDQCQFTRLTFVSYRVDLRVKSNWNTSSVQVDI